MKIHAWWFYDPLPSKFTNKCNKHLLENLLGRGHCQKLDWAFHKTICKQFPLKKGRNVLSEAQKLKKDARSKQIDEMKATALKIVNTENMDRIRVVVNFHFVFIFLLFL